MLRLIGKLGKYLSDYNRPLSNIKSCHFAFTLLDQFLDSTGQHLNALDIKLPYPLELPGPVPAYPFTSTGLASRKQSTAGNGGS